MKPLKKEISKQDKIRARNLLTGNSDKRTYLGVGYKGIKESYSEGDEWEEKGKTWTIKDGIRQSLTKLDTVKEKYLIPIFCPECNSQMKHKFDSQFYNKHHKCYDCVLKFETELKRLGLYNDYQKNIVNSNVDGMVRDFTTYIYERLEESENSYITEMGVVEKWDGSLDKQRVLDSMEESIKYLESLKK